MELLEIPSSLQRAYLATDPVVSIVIPHYILDKEIAIVAVNSLHSILFNTDALNEIIGIDNNSPVQVEYLKQNSTEWVQNQENLGNARAWNQGLKMAIGDYICLMDNDVIVSKDWLSPLMKLASQPEVGIAFPYSAVGGDDQEYKPHLAGYCWVMRREIYEIFGPLNAEMPDPRGYFEDTYYFKQIQDWGYKLKATPESRVIHMAQTTTKKMPDLLKNIELNKQWYENKYGPNYPYLNQ